MCGGHVESDIWFLQQAYGGHAHTHSLSLSLSLSLSRSLTLLQQAYGGHAFAAVNLLAGTLFYRFGVYGCMV